MKNSHNQNHNNRGVIKYRHVNSIPFQIFKMGNVLQMIKTSLYKTTNLLIITECPMKLHPDFLQLGELTMKWIQDCQITWEHSCQGDREVFCLVFSLPTALPIFLLTSRQFDQDVIKDSSNMWPLLQQNCRVLRPCQEKFFFLKSIWNLLDLKWEVHAQKLLNALLLKQ